ncbi:MAG: hypothetical protein IPH74_06395 [Bacteroidetes bacterium]|nr:hypothetical protein [Bacteroidota bacterium]
MKNKSLNLKKLIYALFILGMVSLVGCKREELGMQEASGIKRFFAENQTKSEFFVVNAGVKSSVIGKKGTIIKFEANSLLHQNGTPVTGNVTIELKEVFTKADMVKSNIPTVSNGRILVSQGEFYINAYQNGESLKIKPGKSVDISVPNFTNAGNTMLFRGEFFPIDSMGNPTDSSINWTPFDSTIIPPINIDSTNDSIFDSINYPYPTYFNFPIVGFGWINCDMILDNPNPVSLRFETEGFDPSNCQVFVIFRDIHSVLSTYYATDQYFFTTFIPADTRLTIVAVGFKDGQFYSSFKDIVTTTHESISLDMNPTTENEINQTLESL